MEQGYPTQDPLADCKSLEKINKVNTEINKKYQQEYPELFSDSGTIEELPKHRLQDHIILLIEGTEPPFKPIFLLPEAKLKVLKEYIDKSIKKGIIRESTSLVGAPIFFIGKKDGGVRPIIDYRGLNNITVKDRYTLLLADELRDCLGKAKIFIQIDLKGVYNLIRIAEREEQKTVFRLRYRHYKYLVILFGLTNAPATFQQITNNILRKYLDNTCIYYLDNILVYSEDIKKHEQDIRNIMIALQQAGIKVKSEKY